MSEARINRISNESGTGGPTLSGITTFSGLNYFVPPKGTTAERPSNAPPGSLRFNTDSAHIEYYDGIQWLDFEAFNVEIGISTAAAPASGGLGHRGVFAGGYSPDGPTSSNKINYVNIASTGNAIEFGILTQARIALGALSSSTRSVFAGGLLNPANQSTIDFITISSTGNATSFGSLSVARHWVQTGSNSTRGLFAAGNSGGSPVSHVNIIDYITIASTGNAVDFGDISYLASVTSGSSCCSSTRAIFAGGAVPGGGLQNNIEFVTISTLGNSVDFGDATINRGRDGRCSNATRGLFGGNSGQSNTIEYITIAQLGNSIDFGDLTQGRENLNACSSPTRGVWGGGQTPTNQNTIDYVTIMSTGNAIDFGDLTYVSNHNCACSNGHGGL